MALPDIDKVGSRFEETSLDHIAKNMTLLYVEGRSLFQQAREWNMDAEILARQAAGRYLTNQNRYHCLNGGNPPCKGFGNCLLWYVASVLAPGFKTNISNPTTGGSLVEGVIWEWMADEDPTALGTQGVKLPKCPEKVKRHYCLRRFASCLSQSPTFPTTALCSYVT